MGERLDWRVFLAGALVAVAGTLGLPGVEARRALYHLVLVGCVAVVLVVQRHRPHPVAWRLLGGGLACFALHGLYHQYGHAQHPDHGPLDLVTFVAGYALLLTASLQFVRIRSPGGDREGLIDGAIVATAVAVILWEALTASQLRDARALLDLVTIALFPLLQAVLAALTVRLLFLGTARLPSAWLLMAAVVGGMAANVAYALAEQHGHLQQGSWIQTLWAGSYVAAATGILHPSSVELTETTWPRVHGLPFARVLLLGLALASAPAMVVERTGLHASFVASLLLTILVLWRFVRLVSEREQAQVELRRQALHDPLTGLPNRTLLMDHLGRELAIMRRSGGRMAVLFVDLDRFKEVNDRWGHQAGDEVLMEVAARLRGCVRPQDTLSRFAGDEFVVLCPEVDVLTARGIAERLAAALSLPLPMAGCDAGIGASIGIVVGNQDDDPDGLLARADLAMYRAKERGRRRCELFDDALRAADDRRRTMERDLPGAAVRGELQLAYQPVVTLDGTVTGVEALLRWRHPQLGVVSPDECIAIAESTDVISSLGTWVIGEACRQLADWRVRGLGGDRFELFVNTSARQLCDPELVRILANALALNDCDPGRLCLEITESALLADDDVAVQSLRVLRARGVRVAIDDFGTGYSSLARLRTLPIDVLKIDASFIAGADRGAGDRAIVRAVSELAHSMGMTVVAEGVETAGQHDLVRSAGCDLAQGYLFAGPLEPEAAAALLAAGTLAAGVP